VNPPANAPAPGMGRPSASVPSPRGEADRRNAQGRSLGIDEEPIVDAQGVRGLKVSHVPPGTVAEKAGLRAGDVIRSINGYLTIEPGNLAWIVANAAPDHVLKMNVRTATGGQERTITAQLR
jgi:S1-C subfamily serine protease